MVKYYNGEMYTIPKEFEEEIRADERKKFAFWLINRIHRNSLQRVLSETKNFDIMGIDNILSLYENKRAEDKRLTLSDLAEHDKEVRRKFAEHMRIKYHVDVSENLEWYEKEQKEGAT